MMKRINYTRYYSKWKFPSSTTWLFWVLTAVVIKSIFFICKINEDTIPNPVFTETFAIEGGDTFSYLNPIEHLISKGEYFEDYRMPGYGWIYYLFRLIFPISVSLNMLIIIQLILSSLSVYLLSLISLRLFNKNYFFYSTFIIFSLSTFVSLYDSVLLTESLSASILIFSMYFITYSPVTHFRILLSGLLVSWLIFLKPAFLPLLVIYGLYLLWNSDLKLNALFKIRLKFLLIFLLPFLIIDGFWIHRNYRKYQTFIPLTKSIYYPETNQSYLGSLIEFMGAYGGSIVWWEPGSDITFFKPLPARVKVRKEAPQPPDYIYTSAFNYDSLLIIKNLISAIETDATDKITKDSLTGVVKLKLKSFTISIREEKPLLYHVLSRLNVMKTFFVHSGTYNLFYKPRSDLNLLELGIKIFYSLLYVCSVIMGFIGCFWLLWQKSFDVKFMLLSAIALFAGLVYPVVFKLDEFRYFVPAYPFFLVAGNYAFFFLFTHVNKFINK